MFPSHDTYSSNQDIEAGLARDIIRKIQAERKNLETKLSEQVDVELPEWPEKFENEIKRKTLIRNLTRGETLKVTKINA